MEISWADLEFEDWAQPEFVTSARALSMGNSFLSKVNDEYSAFYNPAGLGSVRQPSLRLFNIHLETNKNMTDLSFQGNVVDNSSDLFNYFKEDGMRELLESNRGNLLHNRINFFPNLTMRYLTIGYFMSKQLRAFADDDASSSLEVGDRLDYGPIVSTNLSIWGGVFKVGASAAYLTRNEYLEHDLDITQELEIQDSDYKKGSAVIITTGAKLTLPVFMLPTFSWVLRNSSQQRFSNIRGAGEPEPVKQTTDLGFSITPILGKTFKFHIEANVKDVANKHDKILERRSMVGTEMSIANKFFVRFGYGDGFGSAGIGFRTRRFSFDFITYATEATPNGFRTLEDRRFAFSVSSGI